MTLHQLRILLAVAKFLNFRKAAEELHLSQPSVFVQFKNLESEYNLKLYKKNGRGIELTRDGERILDYAKDILSRVQNLEHEFVGKPAASQIGPLRIGGTFAPSEKMLPLAIAKFQKAHPDIKVKFSTSRKNEIEERLRKREVDIAVIESANSDPDFTMEYFSSDYLVFFVDPRHPLAKNGLLTLQDLPDTPLIVREDSTATKDFIKELQRRGLKLNIILSCETPHTLKEAVRNKLGAGILFHTVIDGQIKKKRFKLLRVPEISHLLRANNYIVYNKSRPLSLAANNFLSHLRTCKPAMAKSSNVMKTIDYAPSP